MPAAAAAAVDPLLCFSNSARHHLSSIRTLSSTRITSCPSTVLIFSAGGRGQLCAWAADVTGPSSTIGRLRWLASHVRHVTRRRRKSANREQSDLHDIRYMKVTTFGASDLDPDLSSDLFILAAACSDGFMRLMSFNMATRQFSDVAKSDFHGNCLLQVTHVICQSDTAANQNSAIILSAGTEGRICVWDVTEVVRCFCQKYCQLSDNSPSPTDCFLENNEQSFSSLSVTGVIPESVADSSQKTEARDTLASFDTTANYADSSVTDATERLTVSDDYSDYAVRLEQSNASGRQELFHRNFEEAGISEETKACERQCSELEPCCVITAHQSGVNSLALQLRLTGALCLC